MCCSLSILRRAGVYFATVMIMSSISIMMTVLVLNFHHRTTDTSTMSPIVSLYCRSRSNLQEIQFKKFNFCQFVLSITVQLITDAIEKVSFLSICILNNDPIYNRYKFTKPIIRFYCPSCFNFYEKCYAKFLLIC